MNLDTPSTFNQNQNTAHPLKLLAVGLLFGLVLSNAFGILDHVLSRVMMRYEIDPIIQFLLPQLVVFVGYVMIAMRVIAAWSNSIHFSPIGADIKIKTLTAVYIVLFTLSYFTGYILNFLFTSGSYDGVSNYYDYWGETMIDEVLDAAFYIARIVILITLLSNTARKNQVI